MTDETKPADPKKDEAAKKAAAKAEAAQKNAQEKRTAYVKKKEELDALQLEVDKAENEALIAEGKPPKPARALDLARYGDTIPPHLDPPGIPSPTFVGGPDPEDAPKEEPHNMPSGPPPYPQSQAGGKPKK